MPGFLILLMFLALGTLAQTVLALAIPASILSMLLLLLSLILLRRVPASLADTTRMLSPWLALFLVPVSVGVITHEALLLEHGVKILAILAISLVPGIIVCALVLNIGKNKSGEAS
ncbi:MAG: CidA/LrgA family protein [Oceanobacter sp.]